MQRALKGIMLIPLAGLWLAMSCDDAVGQTRRTARQVYSQRRQLSSYSQRSSPSVSPYLNLLRRDLRGGGGSNYQLLVRPALEQRSRARREGLEFLQQRRRSGVATQARATGETVLPPGAITLLQGAAPRDAQVPTPVIEIPPTGHMSSFMDHSHFFPR